MNILLRVLAVIFGFIVFLMVKVMLNPTDLGLLIGGGMLMISLWLVWYGFTGKNFFKQFYKKKD
jgi:hypothetical protein